MGMMSDTKKKNGFFVFLKNSFLYRFIKRVLSLISTLLLIGLLVLGGSMFYFNMQAQQAAKKGQQYVPPFGLYTIISGSMEPNISVYDVVLAVDVEDLSTIKVGDVITFVSTWDVNYGTTVTHRVVNINQGENGEYNFNTKGDNNQSVDGATVSNANLVGKVVLRLPQLGRLQFFLATKTGWFIVVFIPALGVIIWDLVKIFRLKMFKGDVNDIKSTEEADKIYFEGEDLEERAIDDEVLDDNNVINQDEEVKRVPLQRRTKKVQNHSKKEIVVQEETNKTEVNNVSKKRTVKRKKQL